MKDERQFSFNRLFLLFAAIGTVFALGAIPLCFVNISLGIILGVIALCLLLFPAFFMPLTYHFDAEGVTLFYLILQNERYLWKNINSITVHMESHHAPQFFFTDHFALDGTVEGKRLFYMDGHIRKSRRSKRLLKKYWQGPITGYFISEVKTLEKRRLEREERITKQHLTDEIVPMEREKRAEVRRMVLPLTSDAESMGLVIDLDFIYITPDLKEYDHRPHGGYDYTVLIKISKAEETDESRILCLEAELIHVRLDKKSYCGTPDPTVVKALQKSLVNALDSIRQKGLEALLK